MNVMVIVMTEVVVLVMVDSRDECCGGCVNGGCSGSSGGDGGD